MYFTLSCGKIVKLDIDQTLVDEIIKALPADVLSHCLAAGLIAKAMENIKWQTQEISNRQY